MADETRVTHPELTAVAAAAQEGYDLTKKQLSVLIHEVEATQQGFVGAAGTAFQQVSAGVFESLQQRMLNALQTIIEATQDTNARTAAVDQGGAHSIRRHMTGSVTTALQG